MRVPAGRRPCYPEGTMHESSLATTASPAAASGTSRRPVCAPPLAEHEAIRRADVPSLIVLLCATILVVGAGLHGLATATGRGFVAGQDDVYIYVRYAESLAEGRGLVFASGSDAPTVGFNSPLLLAVLGIGAWAGLRGHGLAALSVTLGGVCLSLLGLLVRRRMAARRGSVVATATALLVLTSGPLIWSCLVGLETGPFALCLFVALWPLLEERDGKAGSPPSGASRFATGLLPFCRPEGMLLAPLVALGLVREGASRRFFVAVIAVVIALLATTVVVQGHALPTTGSKCLLAHSWNRPVLDDALRVSGRFLSWLCGLGEGHELPPFFLPLALASALATTRRRPLPVAVIALVLAGAIWGSTRGVGAMIFRYAVPALPLLFLFLGELIHDAARRTSVLVWVLVLAWSLASTGSGPSRLADGARATEALHLRAAERLRTGLAHGSTVAAGDVGVLACFGGTPLLDLVGLTDGRFTGRGTFGDGPVWERLHALSPRRRPTHLLLYPNRFVSLQSPMVLAEGLLRVDGTFATDSFFYRDRRLRLLRIVDPSYWRDAPMPTVSPGLVLEDDLDLADLDAERRHACRIFVGRDEVPVTPLLRLALPEGRPFFDGGRLLRGLSARMRLGPGREKLLVMRITDRGHPAFRLSVDGTTVLRQAASPPSSGMPRWCDASFPFLPPRATAPHARIEIRFEGDHVDGGWSLHGLWIFRPSGTSKDGSTARRSSPPDGRTEHVNVVAESRMGVH